MFSDVIVPKETLLCPPGSEELARLMQMRNILRDRATQKWGEKHP